VWKKESLGHSHRLTCKTVQEITNRYGTKQSDGGCREPACRMIFVTSNEEDIVQLMGMLWFQIPFKDLYLDAAKMPDMLYVRLKVRRVDFYQVLASNNLWKIDAITATRIPKQNRPTGTDQS
jgi:hypothetical protein